MYVFHHKYNSLYISSIFLQIGSPYFSRRRALSIKKKQLNIIKIPYTLTVRIIIETSIIKYTFLVLRALKNNQQICFNTESWKKGIYYMKPKKCVYRKDLNRNWVWKINPNMSFFKYKIHRIITVEKKFKINFL